MKRGSGNSTSRRRGFLTSNGNHYSIFNSKF